MEQLLSTNSIRQALRSLQYGLHILTCGQGEGVHAAAITWVTQISLKPRRVAIGVRKDSHIYPVLRAYSTFVLNVVGKGQETLASSFFKYVPPQDGQFSGYKFETGAATGAPILTNCIAWLECRVVEEANAGGDHGLFVADVLAGGVRIESPKALSLATTGWSYGG
jgi:flavin reductase (DIM6/NTAB) family NADH-FMN oxidoreductase RutF